VKKSLAAERQAWIPLVPTPYGPNALCLELANTKSLSGDGDELPDYQAFLNWSLNLGALDPAVAPNLKKLGLKKPALAKKSLQRAKSLREACFAVFSAIASGKTAPKAALTALNQELASCARKLQIESKNGNMQLNWGFAQTQLDSPIWPIALSAAELLTSPLLSRVRECASPTCGWLFLDVSKNSSRRWCDMLSCGNREKARRFQERHKH